MAQKMTVQLVDDLDGSQSADISTVTFGLDGATYEIDLTENNADNLRKTLDEYVSHARRTSGRIKRGTPTTHTGSTAASHEQAQAIRDWARHNGHEVANRGRIPRSLIEAFEAAQAELTSKTRKRRTKAKASAVS